MNQSFLQKVSTKLFLECICANCKKNFTVREYRLFPVNCLQIAWNQSGHPSAAMNDIGWPSEFFHGFECSFAKENGTKPVVIEPFFMFIMKNKLSFKKLLIVQKINLQPRVGQGSHFDLQRMIFVINGDINA